MGMIDEKLNSTLKSLGHPVSRLYYTGKAVTFFVFQRILSKPEGYADDDNTLTVHTYRVDLYIKSDFITLLNQSVSKLKKAGFSVESIDAEIYESDTGYYHVPLTINFLEE